jgi:NitT/TauT family transport system permease protein
MPFRRVKAARSRTFLDLLVVLAVVMVTWEIVGRSGVLGARAFPPVSEVLSGIPYVLTSGTTRFWHHLRVTLSEVMRGYGIAVVGGSASGVAVALLPRVGRATMPIFVAWEVIPKVALVPLLIVAVGYGQASEVAIAAMMGFFAIFLNTYRGLSRADDRAVQLMRSIGATRYQQFRHYLLPQSLPAVFAGLKIGLSFAFLGAILGELLTLQEGVGFTINAYRGQLRMDLAYAATILVALVGTGLLFLIELLERRAIPWFEIEDRATEAASLG